MLQNVSPQRAVSPDPVPPLLLHFAQGNDVIRTDVVRAMSRLAPGDDRVRQALLGALLDEDPDVRCDAMEALSTFAQTDDAETIRQSLMGDPVREVKLAAIALLVALQDQGSIPLFRKLALSRSEDAVAWEDKAGLWDEWLEIQAAVIRGLGALGAMGAIDDLLAARDDEFGQNLDQPVFEALSQMGREGFVWLLAVARTEPGLARKRALKALQALDPTALVDQVEFLLADQNPEVRTLALPHLAPMGDQLKELALVDPDVGIRVQALQLACATHHELAVNALSDPSQIVQAAALDLIDLPMVEEFHATLLANMQAWILSGDGPLAKSAAENWTRLGGSEDCAPLLDLIEDTNRPLEARLAAVAALSNVQDAQAVDRLITILNNPAQQVRTAAATHLAARARLGDTAAVEALVTATETALVVPQQSETAPQADTVGPCLRVSKKGDVVATSGPDTGTSTLEAIRINRRVESARQDGARKQEKNRKRQALEGPKEIVVDVARVVLGLLADLRDERSESAVLAMTKAPDDGLRYAAYRALAKRVGASASVLAAHAVLLAGLRDLFGPIRACAAKYAAQIAPRDSEAFAALAQCHADTDALVRAEAVTVLTQVETLQSALIDDDAHIRARALRRVLTREDLLTPKQAFEVLLDADHIQTLGQGADLSDDFKTMILRKLADPALPVRSAHVLLQSLHTGLGDGAIGLT